MSQGSDADMMRIANSLERIAVSLEKQVAMSEGVLNTDPGDQMRDAMNSMMEKNPVLRAALEQTERLISGGSLNGSGSS